MAQVHRFRDTVAAYLGNGSTTYLSPSEARQFAKALNAAAREISQGVHFCDSKVGTVQIEVKDCK